MDNKTAIVTGGSRGIGQAIAVGLAHSGWNVAIIARTLIDLEATAKLAMPESHRILPICADVSSEENTIYAITKTQQHFGPISLLINNAGVGGPHGPDWEVDPKEWWNCFRINVLGVYLFTRYVVPSMLGLGKGRIINIVSGQGTKPCPQGTSYGTSKSALIMLSESHASQLRSHGIFVFAFAPGLVLTDMTKISAKSWPWLKTHLQKSNVTPDVVVEKVLRIATGEADELSGCYLTVSDDLKTMTQRFQATKEESLFKLRINLSDYQNKSESK